MRERATGEHFIEGDRSAEPPREDDGVVPRREHVELHDVVTTLSAEGSGSSGDEGVDRGDRARAPHIPVTVEHDISALASIELVAQARKKRSALVGSIA